LEENIVAMIPKKLQPEINNAYEQEYEVPLIGIALPDGYVNVMPRGSTQVYDDDHFSFWIRGRGTTDKLMRDGLKFTVFFRKLRLRSDGVLPIGGIARFYGTIAVHKSGPVYDKVWERLIPGEKKWDPDKKGFAVLLKVERAEDLFGQPLKL
jgi:hypothetical protein